MNRLVRLLCALLLCVGSQAEAQNLGVGLYAFGSFDSRGFDTINLGNLNTHFEIPIFSKQGRGVPFNYTFAYDGLIWSPITINGIASWNPDSEWGFHGQLGGTGVVGYMTNTQRAGGECTTGGTHKQALGTLLDNFTYHEPFGKSHKFKYSRLLCDSGDTDTGDGTSSDGSGYSFDGGAVHTRFGAIIDAPYDPATTGISAGSITDSNGNTITNHGNGSFTDTTGVTALTIGGASSAASPLTFTYPVTLQSNPATTSATATVFYRTYTVQTNFQCAVAEYGPNSVDLPDHVTLADGSTYSFTYEATPGVPGAVTGRLASITLPTGGTIAYTYTVGGCNGTSGINPDGTVGSLERTTSDGNRFYTRGPTTGGTFTNLQDEKGNGTLYQFVSTNGLIYETHRQVYQGPVVFQGTEGATPNLYDQYTCYNGSTPSCDGVALSLPITQSNVTSSYNNGAQLSVSNTYDASGMLTSSVNAAGPGGATLQKQLTTYSNLEELLDASTYDGSGALVTQTTYGYDETAPATTFGIPQHSVITASPGNQTSSHVAVGGSTINTTTAYDDTGTPISTTTPNGTTQYAYDSTRAFIFGTTLPTPSSGVSLATSATFDPQSGAALSSTGMNPGQTTQVIQYDSLLRPVWVALPNGGAIQTGYSANQIGIYQSMTGSTNTNTQTLFDGYGRKSRFAVYNGSTWYQTDYCYDAAGLLQFQPVTYQGNGWGTPKQCSGNGTTYTYDGLGRVISITNADGTAYRQYNGRAVMTTDVNGVQKITQYDLLGRISGVCEISSNTLQGDSPGSCGMDIAGTGYLTTYSYNLAAHTTTIAQGTAQTRTFTTDFAGRTTSVTEPERGTTTYSYSYNSTGLVVTRKRPKANQTNPNVLTTTATQYDSVGRVVSITYDDGTPTKNFAYDASVGWAILNQVNLKGMLSAAWIQTPSEWASSIFSYDPMGRVNAMAECLPLWCGNSSLDKRLDFNYDLAGNLINASDGAGTTTSYSYTVAGEVGQISSSLNDATHPGTPVSNVVNGPNGPISYQLGNGLQVNATYDALGRMNGRYVCGNSFQISCAGGTQVYGFAENSIGSRALWDCDTALNQCANYGYDEFNRLNSTNINSGQQTFSYVYDRYGNRLQQNAPQGGPAPSYSVNPDNNQITSFSYDAAGNLTSDGLHNYVYDAEGNIIDVDDTAGAAYIYNALNQRVQVDWPTVSHQYLYNASGQRVSVWDTNTQAQVQGQYYWGNSPIAYYDSSSLHFQHQDWLGTERLQTSYNGGVEGTYASLPWGDAYNASGSDNDPYHFAQLDRDSESDTHHAQFRQYSSTQGRWMSPDPYDGSYRVRNPQSFNRYTYALNNPLGRVDPSGLDCAYLNDSADGLESVDQFSDVNECEQNGGYWVDGGLTDIQFNGDGSISLQGATEGCIAGNDGYCQGDNQQTTSSTYNQPNNSQSNWFTQLTTLPWMISAIIPIEPIPVLGGIGPAGGVAWNPQTKNLCVSIGIGASAGHNVAGGPVGGYAGPDLHSASPQEVDKILDGWSANIGVNAPPIGPGGQVSVNSSGILVGPTIGVGGVSVSATYAVCLNDF